MTDRRFAERPYYRLTQYVWSLGATPEEFTKVWRDIRVYFAGNLDLPLWHTHPDLTDEQVDACISCLEVVRKLTGQP